MPRYASSLLVVTCALLAACAATPSRPTVAPEPSAPPAQPTAAPAQSTAPPAAALPTTAPTTAPTAAPTSVATSAPAAATEVPAVDAPPFERTLSLQTPVIEGQDVRAAQQRLLDLGYGVGEADSLFGPKTEAAVRAFQALNDVTRDGVIGPETWGVLFDSAAIAYDLHPIVDTQSGLLIGATNAGEWANVDTIGDVVGGRGYRLLGQQAASQGVIAGSAPQLPVLPCDYARVVTFEGVGSGTAEGSIVDPALPIALDGDWNVLPRAVVEVANDNAALQEPIAETLRVLGLVDPQVNITRALRADLDNNGTEETIVAATYRASGEAFPAPSAAVGDYSLLVVIPFGTNRAMVIEADVITQTIEFGAPLQFTLTGIWDLNGDGRMEIVAHSMYYEGEGISIHTLDGITTKTALVTGCGV